MQFTLTEGEMRTMKEMLGSYLPGLRWEAARTDLPSRELRATLNQRIELCERLLAELERGCTCGGEKMAG